MKIRYRQLLPFFLRHSLTLLLLSLWATTLLGQPKETKEEESVPPETKEETPIQVKGKRESDRGSLGDTEGTNIYSGKKTEVLRLEKTNANLALNNTRQIYAKVPGLHIWENDGSGIQPGVGARGLSPNRNWEFNTRMNGYDIASDVFGYPEAYFNPPPEALEKIEIVRGAGSLQYGPQFGGMINYVVKKADPTKPAKVEMKTTSGSYNTLNAYTSVNGTVGKFSYFTYYQSRSGDGWRENADYKTQAGYVNITYQATEKLKVSFEFSRSYYESRQPGGLTDSKFWENPRQSVRSRNWFSAPWNVPSLSIDFEQSANTKTQIKFFGLYGERNSIGVTSAANLPDTLKGGTNPFSARQVDRDWYRNFGMEARQIIGYQLFDKNHSLSFGIRYFNANTDRIRNPNGNSGLDLSGNFKNGLDLRENSLPECFDGSTNCRIASLKFSTLNYAAFAENLFRITDKFSITPGLRYEWVRTTGSGRINEKLPTQNFPLGGQVLPQEFARSQILYGLGLQYQTSKYTNLYANYSKAFRPVTFAEVYAANATYNTVDPGLRDQNGYNADAGYRGKLGNWLQFDAGVFQLRYNNRVGLLPNPIANQLNTVTNVGDSLHRGVEAYIELDPILAFTENAPYGSFSLFTSSANVNARYIKWQDPRLFTDASIYEKLNLAAAESYNRVGNLVENAPSQIHRYGLTYHYKNTFSITYMISYTGKAYADAANTVTPSADGQLGLIPSYTVRDLSFKWNFSDHYTLTGGINNLSNEKYFTRRATGYPGPGILPAEGIFSYIGISAVLL